MTTETDTTRHHNGGNAIFIVRVGSGDDTRYALCHRLTTVSGDHRLPGAGRTVAELVEAQRLLAACLSDDDCDGPGALAFMTQSGQNITININS